MQNMEYMKNNFSYSAVFFAISLCLYGCQQNNERETIALAKQSISIDGVPNDAAWQTVKWQALNNRWLGEPYSKADFQGQYKLLYDQDYLYVLAQIIDDTLIDIYEDPMHQYWDDDCLEIFVDEDGSGGPHRYSHNAFAYHISLDGQVVDHDTSGKPILFNHHAKNARTTRGDTSYWEVALKLYKDTYNETADTNTAATLHSGKKIGFALAYCDNDTSLSRENFIGSLPIDSVDKNQGYRTADVFGKYALE